ncbi:hypothetical protein EON65_37160 [archaeon]|nr:MAG: hypothetical protein EON65_37160 [archaeon]
MSEEADAALLDSLGVSTATLFPTQGALAAEKIQEILFSFTSSSVNVATKAGLAEGWSMWAMCTDATLRATIISQHIDTIYDIVTTLGLVDDDAAATDSEYRGALFVALKIAETLSTVGTMDPTQQLTASFCPKAYKALENILASKLKIATKTPMQNKDSAATYRGDLCCLLVRTLPYAGSVDLPNGLKVISTILLDKAVPDRVKTDAKSALNTISNVAKSSIVHGGADIIALVHAGGNDQLLMNFVSVPELYSNSPTAVHDNLVNVFFKQTYMMYCSLYFRIAQVNPAVLVPHVPYFVANLTSSPNMASVTLMTLDGIATVDPNAVYSHLATILRDSKSVPNGGSVLAKLLSNVAAATTAGAAENVLSHLVNILSYDASAAASVLAATSNVMKLLTDVEKLKKLLPTIEKHKAASDVAYTAIADFAAG